MLAWRTGRSVQGGNYAAVVRDQAHDQKNQLCAQTSSGRTSRRATSQADSTNSNGPLSMNRGPEAANPGFQTVFAPTSWCMESGGQHCDQKGASFWEFSAPLREPSGFLLGRNFLLMQGSQAIKPSGSQICPVWPDNPPPGSATYKFWSESSYPRFSKIQSILGRKDATSFCLKLRSKRLTPARERSGHAKLGFRSHIVLSTCISRPWQSGMLQPGRSATRKEIHVEWSANLTAKRAKETNPDWCLVMQLGHEAQHTKIIQLTRD